MMLLNARQVSLKHPHAIQDMICLSDTTEEVPRMSWSKHTKHVTAESEKTRRNLCANQRAWRPVQKESTHEQDQVFFRQVMIHPTSGYLDHLTT